MTMLMAFMYRYTWKSKTTRAVILVTTLILWSESNKKTTGTWRAGYCSTFSPHFTRGDLLTAGHKGHAFTIVNVFTEMVNGVERKYRPPTSSTWKIKITPGKYSKQKNWNTLDENGARLYNITFTTLLDYGMHFWFYFSVELRRKFKVSTTCTMSCSDS